MLELTGFVYCPKCGKKTLVAHGEKAMFCTQCDLMFFHNTASAVAAIIETAEGILVVRRNHPPHIGSLDLPGGFVDYNESYEEALTREIREELNIAITGLRYFCSFPNQYQYRGIRYFTADVVFLCRMDDHNPISINSEISEVAILSIKEFDADLFAFPSMRNAVSKYFSESPDRLTREEL